MVFGSEHVCSFSTILRCVWLRLLTLSQYSGVTATLHSEQNRSYSCEIGCTEEKLETSLVRMQVGQHNSLLVFSVVVFCTSRVQSTFSYLWVVKLECAFSPLQVQDWVGPCSTRQMCGPWGLGGTVTGQPQPCSLLLSPGEAINSLVHGLQPALVSLPELHRLSSELANAITILQELEMWRTIPC